jgi:hypothetical protein
LIILARSSNSVGLFSDPQSKFRKRAMTATQIVTNKLKMLRGFLCLFRILETMCIKMAAF